MAIYVSIRVIRLRNFYITHAVLALMHANLISKEDSDFDHDLISAILSYRNRSHYLKSWMDIHHSNEYHSTDSCRARIRVS